ncbi:MULTISPECIES: ABC transporter ATP-binding protein [Geobacillus]|jgi:ABC-2 type transport system ATP-binding protein|uniref:ABC transporter ATP-binding protein n=3 Tax=Geobacillus thermodenitrificans TaxID=33940 RepID=A4IP40_GEOTN|nr:MULTISPECIES: ABC transporter ATP-binding protein [Geobacillus]ABO67094.1 ABC transporter ATP-binding protein [Geobacillus thermodenitrificans NG80-2]ARP42851.1 Lantibiotic transport ATP-binding protein SrtF [Geobacillus thermodenitrificans]ATO35877.1 ABC transporter ATP-binding protein [Geobacillus thermodenitrificans]KQB93288.1 ABC transporter ATP-binding protein [Geobacillus sp. PA-3]MEC5186791.1 ABC-2 type transport system ATP-binding protein [Geobacillus thermodenitrificans]
MIEVTGLTVSYRNNKVLDDVDLVIHKGERCALVGRNGAGKSTLIHSLLNLLPAVRGTVYIDGIDHRRHEWKKKVAYLPEKFQLYPQLTGEENVRFFASLHGVVDEQRIEDVLHTVRLWEARHMKSKQYSKGMLQRLGLAIMLYYDADLLILDEPTSGLDPLGRAEVLMILRSLPNKTILLSSHHIDEVRQLCTHVAYLENGKITKYRIEEFELSALMGGE